jgi:hypothetical protein
MSTKKTKKRRYVMKRKITLLMVGFFFLFISPALADGQEEKILQRWFGPDLSSFDANAGVKLVDKDNKISYRGDVTIYLIRYKHDDGGLTRVGIGGKFNGWEGPSYSKGERYLAKLAIDHEKNGNRVKIYAVAGNQEDTWKNRTKHSNLVGGGFYIRSQNYEKMWFFKAEAWGQILSDGAQALVDVGGRLYIYNGKDFMPYAEANFSFGFNDKFANATIGIGLTYKEMLFASIGPYIDLRRAAICGFADAGIDLNKVVEVIRKTNAAARVTEAPREAPEASK